MARLYASRKSAFLSSLAQDFIEEESQATNCTTGRISFLSSLAQDFIEDGRELAGCHGRSAIPELSSSGLH